MLLELLTNEAHDARLCLLEVVREDGLLHIFKLLLLEDVQALLCLCLKLPVLDCHRREDLQFLDDFLHTCLQERTVFSVKFFVEKARVIELKSMRLLTHRGWDSERNPAHVGPHDFLSGSSAHLVLQLL